MDKPAIKMLFHLDPAMKNVPNIVKFFRKGLHWKFEQADTADRTDWFDTV